jgi:predicted RNA-binding Zn ribbon-like protein
LAEPAPGELELIRAFVNTADIDEGKDDLPTAASLGAWLAERGLGSGGRLGEADHRRAIALREALRSLLLANAGEPLEPAAVRALNDEASRVRLVLRFDGEGEGEIVPGGRGIERALGELLAIVHRAMADGSWYRLKACATETCQWAFYDRSKNRSGRWCSMAVCGNRNKVREYRRRSRKTGARTRGARQEAGTRRRSV